MIAIKQSILLPQYSEECSMNIEDYFLFQKLNCEYHDNAIVTKKLLQVYPENLVLIYNSLLIKIKSGMNCEDEFNKLIKCFESEQYRSYCNLGIICYKKGLFEKAVDYFNLFVSINEKVFEYYKKYNFFNEQISECYYYQALCLTNLNRDEDAIECLNKAILLEGKKGIYYYEKAMIEKKLNRIDSCKESLKKALQRGSVYQGKCYQEIIEITSRYEKEQYLKEAYRHGYYFKEQINLYNNNPYMQAVINYRIGNYKEALDLFLQVIRNDYKKYLEPDDIYKKSFKWCYRIYDVLGNKEDALAFYYKYKHL